MHLKTLTVCFLIMALLAVNIPSGECDIYDPFHTKQEKTDMWKTLWSSYPNTEYFPVGNYYNGEEMLMFAAGNITGGKVLWDAEMHGNEDKGAEILYLIAQWLLETNSSQTQKILQENYVMFIPMVNNQIGRGNGDTSISEFGVDLNRNFQTGWQKSDPADDTYSGPNPLSEPETNVIREVFLSYQPLFYVNLHCGAGPYSSYYNFGNTALSINAKNRAEQIAGEMGITPYRTISFGSNGYAIGDASELGVQSTWLIETVGSSTAWKHLPQHYDELVDTYYPKCLAIFIAMCELSSPLYQPPKENVNQNPSQNHLPTKDSTSVKPTPKPTATPSPSPTPNPTTSTNTNNPTTRPKENVGTTLNSLQILSIFSIISAVSIALVAVFYKKKQVHL